MRVFKIMFIGIIVSVFLVGQAYSAPKGNNGKANNGKANNGKSQAAKAKVNNGNNRAVSQTRGQAAAHKQQARRSFQANRQREERVRASQKNNNFDGSNATTASNNRTHANNRRTDMNNLNNPRSSTADDLIAAINRSRGFFNHPNDTRGQGNMGKVDMLDPFGHDKDSDRKELYGNNGRPIHVKDKGDESQEEESPVEESPAEEPPVEELPVEDLLPTEDPLPEEPPIEIIALLDPYVDYLLGLIEEAEINNSMYSSTETYAEYLRGFMDNYIQEHMPTYIAQWTFDAPTSLDASSLIGVDFTQIIDFNTLEDPNIQRMLQSIEEAKVLYDYTPTYATYLEQFMINYFITNYPEYAKQLLVE